VSGGGLNVYGTNWSSTGTLEASSGGSLGLNGTWTNTGSIIAGGGEVVLAGTWTNTEPFTITGGELILGGTWTYADPITINGGELVLNGTWTDTASITVNSGTVVVGGISNLGADAGFGLAGSGGTVDFEGTLNNAGTTLALSDASLSYVL